MIKISPKVRWTCSWDSTKEGLSLTTLVGKAVHVIEIRFEL